MSYLRSRTEGLVRSGGTAPVTRSSPPVGEIPELRAIAERGGIEVSLVRTARDVIGDELFSLTRQDQQECGGFLFGAPTRSWHRRVEIHRATRTGEAIRTSRSVKLDAEEWRRHEAAIAAEGLDDVMCGAWHCHPGTRDCEPSDSDLAALAAVLDLNRELGRSVHYAVGLIYGASEYLGDSWARPRAKAWVARRDRFGRAVCEPAAVRGRL